jgi:hypothetical protein
VRKFRREASYSDEAYATCIIPSVNGEPYGVDLTITQARALSLELSRAILEYELIDGDEPVRFAAQRSDVALDEDATEPRARGWSTL